MSTSDIKAYPLDNDSNTEDIDTLISWFRKQNTQINQFGTGLDNIRLYYNKPDTEQSVANFYNIFNVIQEATGGTTMGWLTGLKDNDKDKGQQETYCDLFNWVLSTLGLSLSNIVDPFLDFVTNNVGAVVRNNDKHPAKELLSVFDQIYIQGHIIYFSGGPVEEIKKFVEEYSPGVPYLNEPNTKIAIAAMNNRRPFVGTIMKSTRFTEYKDVAKLAKDSQLVANLSGNPTAQGESFSRLYQAYAKLIMSICGYAAGDVSTFIKLYGEPNKNKIKPTEITASKISEYIKFGGMYYNYYRQQGGNFQKVPEEISKELEGYGFESDPLFTDHYSIFEEFMNWFPVEFAAFYDRPKDIKKLEENNKKQYEALQKLAELAIPYEQSARASTEATREEFRKNVYQCLLLAAMPWLQKVSAGIRTGRDPDGEKLIPGYDDYYQNLPIPYGGRIIPIEIDPYQNSLNALNMPPVNDYEGAGINQYINASSLIVNDLGSRVSISKVVKNFKDKNGKLVNNGNEVKLPLHFSFAEIVETKDGSNFGKSLYVKSERKSIKEGPLYRDNIVLIKSIQVEFKGGNMATAKSDVEVKMSFTLPDITHLDYAFEDTITIGGETYTYEYSFLDMLTYTNNNSATGFASVFRSQYHPDYNRLLLESYVYYESKGSSIPEDAKYINNLLKETPLVLDIAVVDHEIKKDSKTNQAEVTISYRGYIDSAMTDPSIDALAGPEIMRNRIDREEVVQEKLSNGCDIDQIREQIRLNSQVSTRENIDTLARIMEKLSDSNKIYEIGFKDSNIRSSFSLGNDSIDKPWKILDPLTKNFDVAVESHYKVMQNYVALTNIIGGLHPMTEAEFAAYLKAYPPKLIFPEKGKIMSSVTDNYAKYWMLGKNAGTLKKKNDVVQKEKLFDLQFTKVKFFYFGDLIDVVMDGIHQETTMEDKNGKQIKINMGIRTKADKMLSRKGNDGRYYFKPDPLKVILTSFKWFLPTESGKYDSYVTNLADVPISFDWFSEWYRQEVIEKKLQYYSLNGFINSLAQTVITRILGEVCFDVGAEHKTLFRATTDIGLFSSAGKGHLKKNREANFTDLNSKYHEYLKAGNNPNIKNGALSFGYGSRDRDEYPLLKKVLPDSNLSSMQRSDYCSYMIVYPANASSYEFQAKTDNFSQHDAGIPEFKFKKKRTEFTSNGYMHRGANSLIESMDFSKQDAPYRREVKFFASNMGNLAQISGVYNVKITLSKAAYFLFPGQLIWVDAGVNGKPNNPKSMAFVLGLGGYYQIISVKHEIRYGGGSSANTKTVIEASWVSYGMSSKDQKFNYYKSSLVPKESTPKKACNSILPKAPPSGAELFKKGSEWLKKRTQEILKQQKEQNQKQQVPETPAGTKKEKDPLLMVPKTGTKRTFGLSFYQDSGLVNIDFTMESRGAKFEEFPISGYYSLINGIFETAGKHKLIVTTWSSNSIEVPREFNTGATFDVNIWYDENGNAALITESGGSFKIFFVDTRVIKDQIQESRG